MIFEATVFFSLLGTLFILVVLFFLFSLLAGSMRVIRPKMLNAKPIFSFEPVEFFSRDKVRLSGWWVEGDKKKPVVILCHGIGANRADLRPIANALQAKGFGLLLFDFRGHGESSHKRKSFGYRERLDVVAAVKFLIETEKLEKRALCLYGLSMGAVAITLAFREMKPLLESTAGLRAVVLDSPFARLQPIIRVTFSHWPWLLRQLFLPVAFWMGDNVFRIPSGRVNPIERIHEFAGTPLLLIHSEGDDYIPFEHAKRLFDRAEEPKQFWRLKQADHGDTFLKNTRQYTKRLIEFFDAPMAPKKKKARPKSKRATKKISPKK